MLSIIPHSFRDFLASQPVEKAWIFGSYSRNEEQADSDVDILVRFSPDAKITLFGYCRLIEKIELLLNRKVDLVEEGQLKSFAIESVERDKILIYERGA